jgi:hypothetical protein
VTSEARELRGKAADPGGSYRKIVTDDVKLDEGVDQTGKRPAPRWCPKGLTKTQRCYLQKMRQREIAEKEMKDQRDVWFNQACPMTNPKKTWREKHLAKEEGYGDSSTDIAEEESGEGGQPGVEGEEQTLCSTETMEVNMVFTIPGEFCAPGHEVAAMTLGPEKAMFDKPEEARRHMKPLFIKGHINGRMVGRMVVGGRASINIMPTLMIEKLEHREEELK